MSFMDIMNIMKVSSSKFAFTLIAVAALFVGGSGIMGQDAYAREDPTFTAIHLNTTATKLTFDFNLNGTLRVLDWSLKESSTATPGDALTDVTITDITNGTTSGTVTTANGLAITSYSSTATAANKLNSGGAGTFGFANGTSTIVLVHDAINTDSTYFINYTGDVNLNNNVLAPGGALKHEAANHAAGTGQGGSFNNAVTSFLKIKTNATAVDWISPSVVSAEVTKKNPSQVVVKMSEPIANVNATAIAFSMTTGGGGNAAVPATTLLANGTQYLYVNLQNPARTGDDLTLTYATGNTGYHYWITDAINSERWGGSTKATTSTGGGVGNRVANFTVTVTNWIPIGLYGNDDCYDCSAPTVEAVQVSLDGSTPVTVTDDNPVQINAGTGDTVSVMVTVADNVGADTMTFAGLYTNFGDAPDNLYYANNFDSFKSMSTSYYEWNARGDDTAFGNTDAITWDAATATVNPDRTQTITYTMTINDSMDSSQVWVDLGDMSNNYGKSALPITLEVAGPPAITFASDDSQKVVSYFNESILMAIVSQWTATSSDDATNVEQLSSVLGIEDQLPTWTTNLASWVSDDKIDVADMIVAVEYVINQ